MSTSQNWARQPLTGGINTWDSEDSLQQGQVVDSRNFLFYGSQCLTRPGLKTTTPNGTSNPQVGEWFQFAQWFPKLFAANTLPANATNAGCGILLQGNNLGVFYSPVPIVVQISSGPGFGTVRLVNAAVVNDNILIAVGDSGGILRLVPSVSGVPNSYSAIAAATYQYITGFSNRAVGALNTATGANTIGWSASGDETNWTTQDAGNSTLVDINGVITGLGKVSNVLVILHTRGIHLGTLTGVAPPVGPIFRFENFSAEGQGCFYPGTAAFHGNICAFVGDDDVYTYNLQQITPIGREIKKVLLPLLNSLYAIGLAAPITYKGFFCNDSYYGDVIGAKLGALSSRLQYHLVPVIAQNTPVARILNLPHFIYDFAENKWSIHSYSFPVSCGYDAQVPALFDTTTPDVHAWDPETPQENGAQLIGPVNTLEDAEHDFKVDRVLMRFRNFGKTPAHSTLSATQPDNRVVETRDTQTCGTDEATGRWLRRYFSHTLGGQDFQWKLDIDPGARFAVNYMSYHYSSAGEFKGQTP